MWSGLAGPSPTSPKRRRRSKRAKWPTSRLPWAIRTKVAARRSPAKEAYAEAVKQDPTRGDAWARLAVLYDREAKFSESAECYRKAKTCQGEDPALCCNMGYSLYLQRRWAEAEASLRQAIALDEANKRAHNNLGLVLAHAGREVEALDEFRKAGCTEAECQVNLALTLAVEGEWSEAKAHYEKALAADPSAALAKRGLQNVNDLMAKVRSDADKLLRADTAPASSPETRPGRRSDSRARGCIC